jgi:hypothetical protein
VCAVEAPRELPWRGPRLVLAVGCLTLAGGRTDWLVEKATELGAHSLVPLVTERSNAGAGRSKFRTGKVGGGGGGGAAAEAAAGEEDYRPAGRLARLAAAAMKQTQRAHGLELRPPTALRDAAAEARGAALALVAAGGAPPALRQLEEARRRGAGSGVGDDGSQADTDPWCAPLHPCESAAPPGLPIIPAALH